MATLERVAGRATWLLSRANIRSQTLLADGFATEGLRGYHFRVLAALDQHGPSSQADLARNTGIDRSDIVATVNDLVDAGHVRRARDPHDGRRNLVTITRRGLRTLERLDVIVGEVQDRVLAPLTSAERKALVRLLTKLT